jgi:hypothetical protein
VRTLKQGRHRYVRLEGPDVADLIERLSTFSAPERPKTLRASVRARRLSAARTCYDHLAGRLGVAVRDGMLASGLLDDADGLRITRAGRTVLGELGVELGRTRRPVVKDCLDWTERREHLAGVAGARICRTFLDRGWTARIGTGRAVRVTPAGAASLTGLFGPDPAWSPGCEERSSTSSREGLSATASDVR